MPEHFEIGVDKPAIEDVISVAQGDMKVLLGNKAAEAVRQSRQNVESIVASNRPVYGLNTGVGKLATVALEPGEIDLLQRNIVASHAAGTGAPLSEEIVRGAMFLRACSLARGFSGIKLETLMVLIDFINEGIVPIVPSQGSVGSSGDLAPLSHIALALTGQGQCYYDNRLVPVSLALKLSGLSPARLEAKEGLALINGTQVMTSILATALYQAMVLAVSADVIGSMTLEAVHGCSGAFAAHLHQLRPYPGQMQSAANIRNIIAGSRLVDSEEGRVQDGYSLRCMPVVHGASRDAIEHVWEKVSIELESVTDNPLIFSEEDVISGANFHGQPMALAADYLGIAVSELGNISERRINRMLDGTYDHLPLFLAKKPGLHSGLMIPQYTAAALASENKGLAHPNSADSIPTSANQEDHNSMGTIAARNALSIVENVSAIIGIEALTAAQALEFSDAELAGKGTRAAHAVIREIVEPWDEDRFVHPDIENCKSYIATGDLITRVEPECEELS